MSRQPSRDHRLLSRLIAVHQDALDFYRAAVPSSWVRPYLEDRKLAAALEPGSIWHVGHAPAGWTSLVDHLRQLGYRDATLEQSGLAQRACTGQLIDRFRDRLMLPIRDSSGDIVAFIGRAHPGAGCRVPKYLNSPTTPVFSKGQTLLGLAEQTQRLRDGARLVLAEGPLDAIAVSLADHSAVGLALCGTALTPAHAAVLAAEVDAGARVVVAADSDTAGRTSAGQAFIELIKAGIIPWTADLPPGLDPADVALKLGAGCLAAAVGPQARPLIDLVIEERLADWSDRLQWAEGKVGAARDAANYIALLPVDQRVQPVVDVAARTGLPCSEVALLVVEKAVALSPRAARRYPRVRSDGIPPLRSGLGGAQVWTRGQRSR